MNPIIIDTDPGIDDVVAITAALFSNKLDVKLITTVGGNVGIENTTKNAVDLVTFLGKNVPIARGAAVPLVKKLKTASSVHGTTGVGEYKFSDRTNDSLLSKEGAVVELKNHILNSSEPVTLVPIGPLTNIALLLRTFPEVKKNIKEIVLMGGAAKGGNVTPVAEFNIYVDPHAARIVFDEDINIVMCGLDLTNNATITSENVEAIKEYGKVGDMISEMLAYYGDTYKDRGLAIHDLCTILYLTHPEFFQGERANVHVVTEGEAAGCTVVNYSEDGNVFVCLNADLEALRNEFISIFKSIYESVGV